MSAEQDKMLRKSVDGLVDKARLTSGLAKDQRAIADLEHDAANAHHVAAHKLEVLSEQLADDAKDLKKKMDQLPK